MTDIKHYAYRVVWSVEDGEFVATVAEFPSLSWLHADQAKALRGLVDLVDDVMKLVVEQDDFAGWVELLCDPVRAKRAYWHLVLSGELALPAVRHGLTASDADTRWRWNDRRVIAQHLLGTTEPMRS